MIRKQHLNLLNRLLTSERNKALMHIQALEAGMEVEANSESLRTTKHYLKGEKDLLDDLIHAIEFNPTEIIKASAYEDQMEVPVGAQVESHRDEQRNGCSTSAEMLQVPPSPSPRGH